MGVQILPNMKTVIESNDNGTKSVWFKYENVSDDFVKKLQDQIQDNIWSLNVTGMAKIPIDLPKEDQEVMETLVETVKMLDKPAATAFLNANRNKTNKIGYLPLIWAASIYLGSNLQTVEAYLKENAGKEKDIWENQILKML